MKIKFCFALVIFVASPALAHLKINVGDKSLHKFTEIQDGRKKTGTLVYTVSEIKGDVVTIEDRWRDDGGVEDIVGEVRYSRFGLEADLNKAVVRCLEKGGLAKVVKIGGNNVDACERAYRAYGGNALETVAPIVPHSTVHMRFKETAEESGHGVATDLTIDMISYSKGSGI